MTEAGNVKTIIAEDIEIEGTITCASDIQFDGKLTGDLECSGNAIIGNKSVINGNISVKSITIMGKIDGNIDASDRIEMKATTRLNGDIKAKRLTVEDGVTFVGKSEVNPSGSVSQKPASIPNTQGNTDTDKPAESESNKQKNMFGKK